MPRKQYKTIQLLPQDYDDLMATANRLKGPIGISLSGADAVRLLVSFQKGFNAEQARKYKEAIDMWQKEQE